jgi:hypothetical protein
MAWRAVCAAAVVAAACLTGCASHRGAAMPAQAQAAPVLTGDAAHPGQTQGWVETKLFFGLGPVDHPEQCISETEWRKFLDKNVTPRFPDGLSVVDLYGQWQGKSERAPERLHTKMMLILYQDDAENRAKIDAIRAAWKQNTGDQSVLRVTEPADVSF